jgi:hypothetical protein
MALVVTLASVSQSAKPQPKSGAPVSGVFAGRSG